MIKKSQRRKIYAGKTFSLQFFTIQSQFCNFCAARTKYPTSLYIAFVIEIKQKRSSIRLKVGCVVDG